MSTEKTETSESSTVTLENGDTKLVTETVITEALVIPKQDIPKQDEPDFPIKEIETPEPESESWQQITTQLSTMNQMMLERLELQSTQILAMQEAITKLEIPVPLILTQNPSENADVLPEPENINERQRKPEPLPIPEPEPEREATKKAPSKNRRWL